MKSGKSARALRSPVQGNTDFDKVGKYDQNQVNGFEPSTIDSFLDLVELSTCSTVLDAMAGDGNLTDHMFDYCGVRGINPPAAVALELSSKQCSYAEERFKGRDVKVVHGDILSMKDLSTGTVLRESQFDAVMLKSGNHEIPLERQEELYRSLFRVLKPGGKLVNLGVLFDDEDERREFREILRVKDTLAGLDDAAKNRYFLTRKELYPLLQGAGFSEVSCGRHVPYIGRTSIVSDVYFSRQRDEKKVELERTLMAAIHMRKKFQVIMLGDDSIYTFPGEMTVARKPKISLVR